MTSFKLEWHGDELLKAVADGIDDALYDAADKLANTAAAKAPKGSTGHLRESAYASNGKRSTYQARKWHRKELKVKDKEAVAAFAVFYAAFIENGTKKMAAKPFLRPAFDELKGQLAEGIVAKVGKKLGRK